MTTYLLDANVFIQAKNLHYGIDFCPAFWEWLIANNANGRVFSIDKVRDEIAAGADELTDWAQQQGSNLFRATDSTVVAHFPTVSRWATSQQYEPAAISTFLQVADYYLIAHAPKGQDLFWEQRHDQPSTFFNPRSQSRCLNLHCEPLQRRSVHPARVRQPNA